MCDVRFMIISKFLYLVNSRTIFIDRQTFTTTNNMFNQIAVLVNCDTTGQAVPFKRMVGGDETLNI